MYRWRIQISSNDSQLLSFLMATLQDSPTKLVVEDGYYYLVSNSFESYQFPTEVQELYTCADRIIDRINGLLKLQFQVQSSIFKTTPVIYVDDTGLLHLIVVETIKVTDEIRGYVGDNFFQDAAGKHPDLINKWLKEGNDQAVDEVIRYYISETSWFNLYKIYEVIEHDSVSRKVDVALLKTRMADDFTYSANNFTASEYNARHFSKKFEKAPQKPTKRTALSLNVAQAFIDDLLIQWLKTKA